MARLDLSDRVRMSCVCKSWRGLFKQEPLPNAQFPWLRLPQTETGQLSFYDMLKGKVFNFRLPKSVHCAYCLGSSKGWIMFKTGVNWPWQYPKLVLLNPITEQIVQLPVISFDSSGFIIKLELSSSDPSCFIVAVILDTEDSGGGLAFCRPGDDRWLHYHYESQNPDPIIRDILFHRRMLHILTEDRYDRVNSDFSLELTNCTIIVKLKSIGQSCYGSDIFVDYEENNHYEIWKNILHKSYLVESNGELLIVCGIYNLLTNKELVVVEQEHHEPVEQEHHVEEEHDVEVVEQVQEHHLANEDDDDAQNIIRDLNYLKLTELKVKKIGGSCGTLKDLNNEVLFVGKVDHPILFLPFHIAISKQKTAFTFWRIMVFPSPNSP